VFVGELTRIFTPPTFLEGAGGSVVYWVEDSMVGPTEIGARGDEEELMAAICLPEFDLFCRVPASKDKLYEKWGEM